MNGYLEDSKLIMNLMREAKEASKLLHQIASSSITNAEEKKRAKEMAGKLFNAVEVIEI
jgi:hypothetical protein